jgi:subtilisin family serine protease
VIERRAVAILSLVLCASCVTVPRDDEPLPASIRDRPGSFVVITVRNDGASAPARAGSTMRGYDGAARYSVSSQARSALESVASSYRLREVSSWPIVELGIHCAAFEVPPGETVSALLPRLKQDRRVESAQPLNVFATHTTSYDDPYQALQENLVTMNVAAAHRWSRGSGVHVAIIDTGADTGHPDLAGRVAEKQNFVDADDWAFNHDRHGTAVAGVIAADSNNRIGIVGVAPEARLHLYKACWQRYASGGATCNTFTLAKGLAAAIDARVNVVNLSLAGPDDPLLTRLVIRGQQRGIVFVGATPPELNADTQSDFPTSIAGVIKVAAVEQQFVRPHTLLAPGRELLTLVPEGRYDFISGNSLATAGITGAVALLLSRDRRMDVEQLERLLTASTGITSSDAGNRSVNACLALATLLNEASCQDTTALPVAAE